MTAQYITPTAVAQNRAPATNYAAPMIVIELAPPKDYALPQKRTFMSGDLTQNLSPRSFEERVLAEFAAIRGELATIRGDIKRLDERLTALEEKVDRRLQETRPIWEDVQARLQRLESKFDVFFGEHSALRLDVKVVGRRVDQIERQLAE